MKKKAKEELLDIPQPRYEKNWLKVDGKDAYIRKDKVTTLSIMEEGEKFRLIAETTVDPVSHNSAKYLITEHENKYAVNEILRQIIFAWDN